MEKPEKNKKEVKEETTLKEQQSIWSWGAGTEGQLCTCTLNDEYTPQLLHNLTNTLSSSYGSISTLSCGGAHVIALTSGGKVLTWGRGASGQLGHGQIVPNCLNPKLVDSLLSSNICHVSAGWNHSGFVSDSGCLFTCGDGSFGQLGHANYQSCSYPVEVSFFSSKHVMQVACGMRHTLVLTEGHQLYAFGANKRGQLGVSQDKIRSLNIPQPCLGFGSAEVVKVVANGEHSAVISADGHLFTWGRSFSGNSNVCVPELLPSSLSYKDAALGWNHALLLTGNGEVSMLGGNHHGALSDPEKIAHAQNSPGNSHLQKIPNLDGRKVVQVAAGSEHSAIVTEDGEIYTWGWGEHGQLGLGNTSDQTLPQLVDLQNVTNDNHLMFRVYCGSGFTFAIKSNHEADDYI